jgi:hypothetical protein
MWYIAGSGGTVSASYVVPMKRGGSWLMLRFGSASVLGYACNQDHQRTAVNASDATFR